MATLTELTAEIVSAHASGSSLTSEELIKNIQTVYGTLKALEAGESTSAVETPAVEAPTAPVITIKQAYKSKDEVLCMVCGKGFKTLKRHLMKAHDLKTGEYRKQFGIPSTKSLSASNYVESRRQMALDRNQGDVLAKARAVRVAKNAAVPVVKTKTPVPAVKVKAPVPAVKVKPSAPAVKKKPAVPAKVEAVSAPANVKKAPTVKPTVKAKK